MLKSPAALYSYDAVSVAAAGMPSPLKSQLHSVTAASSVLALAKAHGTSIIHGGTVKIASGAAFLGGGRPPPLSPQAEPSTSSPVTTTSVPIDRIESSQPGATELKGRQRPAHEPEPCQSAEDPGRRPVDSPRSASTWVYPTSVTPVLLCDQTHNCGDHERSSLAGETGAGGYHRWIRTRR